MKSLENKANAQFKHIVKICNNDNRTMRLFSGKIDSEKFDKWAANSKNGSEVRINSKIWKKYEIGFLFNSYTGGDLILSEIIEGDIPVITHSAVNNSVGAYSNIIQGQRLFNHNNTISLADRGTFFATIQNQDFYIGTRVKALEAKFQCNPYILIFIASVINNESYRFNYGRNCTGGLDKLKILLPSIKSNSNFSINGYCPDWDFMENYIKSLPYSRRIQ